MDGHRDDPLATPPTHTVSLTKRPLYVAGVALLFLLFVALSFLSTRRTNARAEAAAERSVKADEATKLRTAALLAELERKAQSQPAPPEDPYYPPPPPGFDRLSGFPYGDPGASPRELQAPAIPPPPPPAPARPTPPRIIAFSNSPNSPHRPALPRTTPEDVLGELVRSFPTLAGATEPQAALALPTPNHLERTTAFLERERPAQQPLLLRAAPPHRSPLVLLQGTLVPATLAQTVVSEAPGLATALVRADVWDSLTGRYLLIPQGSRLLGEYSADVVYGDSRLLVVWNRLILPDGSSYQLHQMPGTDLAGATGLDGRVNNHWGRLLGSSLALSVLSAGAQLSQPRDERGDPNRTYPSIGQVGAAALGQQLHQTGSAVINRELQVRPTITVPLGTSFNVQLRADVQFDRPYSLR